MVEFWSKRLSSIVCNSMTLYLEHQRHTYHRLKANVTVDVSISFKENVQSLQSGSHMGRI